jgi:putative hemolysin
MITLLIIDSLILAFLLFCSGFFSSAEVAFFSLSPIQIRRLHERNPAAGTRITKALHQPTSLLSAILIGNTLVNVCASVMGYAIVKNLGTPHAEQITVPVLTALLLIFGEIGPKRLAIHHSEGMATVYAPIMLIIMRVTAPMRFVLEHITTTLKRFFQPRGRALTEDEFETLVELSQEAGILDEDESDMVKSIMRLEDLKASDIMTPRVDIIGIDLNDPPSENDRIIRKNRLPRMLLFRDHLDNVEGVLDVRRYLLGPENALQHAWLAPFFVPECAHLNAILEQFQSSGNRLAVVVDEYGGTAGIITRGDILEEIAGDLARTPTLQKLQFETIGPGHWLVDGQISLEDLNDELDLELDAEGVDRLAGWISAQAERLPRPGDTVQAQGCRAIVRQMRQHRITLVELFREEESAP